MFILCFNKLIKCKTLNPKKKELCREIATFHLNNSMFSIPTFYDVLSSFDSNIYFSFKDMTGAYQTTLV